MIHNLIMGIVLPLRVRSEFLHRHAVPEMPQRQLLYKNATISTYSQWLG
jgi:hypothetical protein